MYIGITGNIIEKDLYSKIDLKSDPVENDAYFLTVLRYIHQNPIKSKALKTLMNTSIAVIIMPIIIRKTQ